MKLVTTAYEFDLSKMDDEALVVLARELDTVDFVPRARQEIILRHFPRVGGCIARLATQAGLGREDTEEARQNAEFAIEEAIDHYDLGQLARKNGKSFRQFLRQVVRGRFKDFVKHLRRDKRHYDHSSEAIQVLDKTTENGAGRLRPGSLYKAKVNDPARTVMLKEDWERLRKAVSQLSNDCRIFWEGLCAGKKLIQIAADLQLTDAQANHRKRKMFAQLLALLGNKSG